mgnify:CR=1 FL=1
MGVIKEVLILKGCNNKTLAAIRSSNIAKHEKAHGSHAGVQAILAWWIAERESNMDPLHATVIKRPKYFVVKKSGAHGVGLFATRDVREGTIIASYPIDFLTRTDKNGRWYTYYHDETVKYTDKYEREYSMEMSSDFYKETIRFTPRKRGKNPYEKAHLINDVKTTPGCPTVEEYERDTEQRKNVEYVDYGEVIVAQTTQFVPKGAEFLAAYGRSYWVDSVDTFVERITEYAIETVVKMKLRAP